MSSLFDHWRKHYSKRERHCSVDEVFRAFCAAKSLRQRAPNLCRLVTTADPNEDVRSIQANIEWLACRKEATDTLRGVPVLDGKEEGVERAAKRQKISA